MNLDKMHIALDAFEKDGKIECIFKGVKDDWKETRSPCWDFNNYDYRPIPKRIECWVNEYDDCIVLFKTESDAFGANNGAIRTAIRMIEANE